MSHGEEHALREEVQYSRAVELPGPVLSTARFSAFRCEPQYHLDCHIALVADGVQRQSFQGESMVLTRGAIQLLPSGEIHDGIAGSDESYTLQTRLTAIVNVQACRTASDCSTPPRRHRTSPCTSDR